MTPQRTRFAAGSSALVACSLLALACGPYGDGASSARAARREREQRASEMASATRSTPRGRDLAGADLESALRDRTWVSRYESFPNGMKGKYILYRSFRPDGRFVATDNFLNSAIDEQSPDSWKVEGPRLCILWSSFDRSASHCYRVARAQDGALQVYVDEPGSEFQGLLTFVVREVLTGPAPQTLSVLRVPG